MSTRTSHLDDVEVDRSIIDGDGESSIDLYAVPEQLGQPDGKSSVELPDTYIGRENVLQSVENAAGDNTLNTTSEPRHSKLDSAHKQQVKENVDPPTGAFPTGSVENLQSGNATLSGKPAEAPAKSGDETKPAAKRTRSAAKAETTKPESSAEGAEAKTAE